jgi:hypothetical protein
LISGAIAADPRYTPFMPRRILVLIFVVATVSFAQDAPKPQQDMPNPQEYITAQFGASFVYLDKFPVITGDLDGDGTEDAIFVTSNKENAMLDEEQYHYKVIDPYDEYFGWGDPRVTSTFNAHDPSAIKFVLIVHDWRSSGPKTKLVVINLPFEKIRLTRVPTKNKKRKVAPALLAEDLGGLKSAIYWDGKKYKWTSMDGMD